MMSFLLFLLGIVIGAVIIWAGISLLVLTGVMSIELDDDDVL